MPERPLRSLLFAPGNQPRKVAKVATVGADAVILDLEDAVPRQEKEATRPVVREAVVNMAAETPGPLRFIRVNALDTGLTAADLEAVVCAALDGVVVPKIETADELREVEQLLGAAEASNGLSDERLRLLPLVETARGVLNAPAIAAAGRRVARLGFGGADFCRDVGVRFSGALWESDGLELMFARSQIVLASRAAGLAPPMDTVWLDVRDPLGLEQDARTALRLGFGAKACIHPNQVELVNRMFSPSPDELEYARRVVEAFDQAEQTGSASIAVDGRLVDYAIVIKAREVLERFG